VSLLLKIDIQIGDVRNFMLIKDVAKSYRKGNKQYEIDQYINNFFHSIPLIDLLLNIPRILMYAEHQ